MKISAILTGSTGMVGEGVLLECLLHKDVDRILLVSRRPSGISHPKIKEIIVPDFFDLASVEKEFSGYNACFFCLGVSSVGMNRERYYKSTYTLTMNFADLLSKRNPDMVFCYISGAGTDTTEKGIMAWARVKGKTENDLMKLPFKAVYNFRPGVLQPTRGQKNTIRIYKYLSWMIPVIRLIAPKHISTLKELGLAMINVVRLSYPNRIIEVKEIVELAKQ